MSKDIEINDFTNKVKYIFSESGVLSETPGFEYRSQQQQMAEAICTSLENNSHKIIEAPTGTGKTYAYLVPAILFAKANQRKAVISTRTINLQEQLVKKDIPTLKKILDVDFTYEILKGRSNYICMRRLSNALRGKEELFVNEEQKLLQEIYNFVQKEDKGELQELPFDKRNPVWSGVWSQIYAEQGICTSKSCGSENSNCFFQRAKQRVKNADIVVMNHSLFFTLYGLFDSKDSQGLIYANDFVIFDECHTIERIAAENISESVSREQLRFWLNRIFNPRSQKGYFAGRSYDVTRLIQGLLLSNDSFFDDVRDFVLNKYKSKKGNSEIRILEPLKVYDSFTAELDELFKEIKRAVSTAQNTDEQNEISNFAIKINSFKNTIRDFLNQNLEEYVYWIEISQKGRQNISLEMTPIDTAEFFRKHIFSEKKLCFMTSATLSVNGSLDYFCKSIGAEKVDKQILDTPFNYSRQMEVIISNNIPEPKVKSISEVKDMFAETPYETSLKETIYDYVIKTNGGVLVLFTSIVLMNKVSYFLKDKLKDSGINIFTQGEGFSSNKILNSFKEDENSILLGVDSFWMGVDVPGVSLRSVIITRLPFDIPDQPIVEAKCDFIRERGGNPFYEYSLPSAVLKFKQGIGRLIRNKTDAGTAVILDRRVLTSSYGKYFLAALPKEEFTIEGENADGSPSGFEGA